MADQNSNVGHNQNTIDAISRAEEFLMLDENDDDPLLLNDFVNGLVGEPSGNAVANYGTNFPGICFQENISNDQNCGSTDFPQTSSFGNPIRISVWPVPPSPHSCTCCQTLREIFHVNGSRVLKLHIHGRLGLISHAVLERFDSNLPSENHEYHMFDFCQESISNVKQFLVQYCVEREREGYIMLQDPLSNFYAALCTGVDGNGSPEVDIFLHQTSGGDGQMNNQEEEGNAVRLPKSHIASQRERTGKMKLRDLARYFHLPINVAAKEINLCPSAIKSICRKEGLSRWPHRTIKSINSEISKKKQSLNANNANERARALTEIQKLERKLANFYQAYGG